jgi:putative inorganic carbon (hco3(-)) transporter
LKGAEFFIVALAIGASAFNSAWLPWALLVAALFWPLRRLATGRWSVRTEVDWSVALLALTLPVTLWASSQIEKSLPQVLRLLAGVALFYALVNWTNPQRYSRWGDGRGVRLAVDLTLAGGLLLALAAPFVVQWNALKLAFVPSMLYSHFRLLAADPANPNVMAGSLVLLLPLGIGLLLFAWRSLRTWERLLTLSFVLLGGSMLLLTQSRGAWLAVAAALAVLIGLRFRWAWVFVLVVILAVVAGAWAIGFSRVADYLVSSATLGGVEGRIEVWSRAVYMIQDFPFTGIGMGTFSNVADRLYPFFLYLPGTVEHAHNLYLQAAVDLGLPGLIAWLAILLGLSYSAWRLVRKTRQGWLLGLGAGLLAAQVALVVHGLTDAVTWGMVRPAPLVWLVWGIIAAANVD